MVWKTFSILCFCLLAAACGGQVSPPGSKSPAASDWLVPSGDGPDATRGALYACFDAATALRIATTPSTGEPSTWTFEKFRDGFCLALPQGSRVTRQQPIHIGDQSLTRIQVQGSTLWLYVPDWSIRLQQNGAASRRRASFAPMLIVSQDLLDYAEKHTACMRDVLDLNTRVIAHNERFLEEEHERRGQETITKTVIKLNPTALDAKGRGLNREISDYQARCTQFQTLEASKSFILFLRHQAGLEDGPLPPAKAAG